VAALNAAELYPVIKEPTLSRQKTQLKGQLNLTDGKMQFDVRRRLRRVLRAGFSRSYVLLTCNVHEIAFCKRYLQ